MKKITPLFLVIFLFGFGSCSLIDELIPNVDTEYSITFPVDVGQNSGTTESDIIDVTDSQDYQDFEDNINGFEINKVLFQILDYDQPQNPDDLYFEGEVHATSIDGTDNATVGTISRIQLSAFAGDDVRHQVNSVANGIDKIVDWLDSPGQFTAYLIYELTDADGNPYSTEGKGINFDVKIIYDVTVDTGTGK